MIRLRELREKRHSSMRQIAQQLGIPYTTYVNYEKGIREPNSEMLVLLSDFLMFLSIILLAEVIIQKFKTENFRIMV